MKKTNFSLKLILIFFIWIVFSISFLLPLPSDFEKAADEPSPVTIISPTDNSHFNNKTVEFSGTLAYGSTPLNEYTLVVKDYNKTTGILIEETDITANIVDNAGVGQWTFSKDFTDGLHELSFEANDLTNTYQPVKITSLVDTTRPFVKETKLVSIDRGDGTPWNTDIDNMTHVPLNAQIKITINESNGLNVNSSSIDVTPVGGAPISGTNSTPERDEFGNYVFTFTPTSSLERQKTYNVSVKETILDDSGNIVYPKFYKFTTISEEGTEDPHGNYMANTNVCSNCHGAHVAGTSNLENSKYQTNPFPPVENYCMACHDGTGGAPMPNKYNQNNNHNHFESTGSCSSCHDPHNSWSEGNPNKFRDHYVFDHVGTTMDPPRIVDSDYEDCENCHDTELDTVLSISHYRVYSYNNANSATGVIDDYSLCFRCHDGTKKWTDSNQVEQTISNIKQYFDDTGESDTTKGSQSLHRISANDGSNLTANSGSNDGHIPCAECHDTHGSSNIKILKEQLGQEDRQSFTATTGDWDAAKEKSFCTKCHNGTTTISGVSTKKFDANDINHNGTTETCSYCHGGTSRSLVEAAHAPKTGTP
ncbi:Ig-like domain-containing protein [Bacillus sp. 1NLA3E]|uniref:Ig-like domain-containing protein n=1 Tax=Bacillus sp. 1NLA3E TaxID=666686 RepID=UPI000247ECE8|nr:Ig-like domain-containing protein [Bacillus sp. 1NLA3E]AGK55684.1 cytochrome C family protein [Bacillus sp. 1NLA3E]